jgi:hypothetical protein
MLTLNDDFVFCVLKFYKLSIVRVFVQVVPVSQTAYVPDGAKFDTGGTIVGLGPVIRRRGGSSVEQDFNVLDGPGSWPAKKKKKMFCFCFCFFASLTPFSRHSTRLIFVSCIWISIMCHHSFLAAGQAQVRVLRVPLGAHCGPRCGHDRRYRAVLQQPVRAVFAPRHRRDEYVARHFQFGCVWLLACLATCLFFVFFHFQFVVFFFDDATDACCLGMNNAACAPMLADPLAVFVTRVHPLSLDPTSLNPPRPYYLSTTVESMLLVGPDAPRGLIRGSGKELRAGSGPPLFSRLCFLLQSCDVY